MEKIKHFMTSEKGKDALTVIIVILVGLASFGLGRLSKQNENAGIHIQYPTQNINDTEQVNVISAVAPVTKDPGSKSFFASSKGSRYYSLGCSGGQTIKPENRIYFATSTEAEAAGYTLSSTCK